MELTEEEIKLQFEEFDKAKTLIKEEEEEKENNINIIKQKIIIPKKDKEHYDTNKKETGLSEDKSFYYDHGIPCCCKFCGPGFIYRDEKNQTYVCTNCGILVISYDYKLNYGEQYNNFTFNTKPKNIKGQIITNKCYYFNEIMGHFSCSKGLSNTCYKNLLQGITRIPIKEIKTLPYFPPKNRKQVFTFLDYLNFKTGKKFSKFKENWKWLLKIIFKVNIKIPSQTIIEELRYNFRRMYYYYMNHKSNIKCFVRKRIKNTKSFTTKLVPRKAMFNYNLLIRSLLHSLNITIYDSEFTLIKSKKNREQQILFIKECFDYMKIPFKGVGRQIVNRK